jgi:hypothetical protein
MRAEMHVNLHIKWRLRCSDLIEKVVCRVLHCHLSRKFVQPFLGCNLYNRRCADPRCEVNGSVFAKYWELADSPNMCVDSLFTEKHNRIFFLPRVNSGAVHFFFTAAVFKPIK